VPLSGQINNDWLLQNYSLIFPNYAPSLNIPDNPELAWVTVENYRLGVLGQFNTFHDEYTSTLGYHHGVRLRSTSQMRFTLGEIDRFFGQLKCAADIALGLGQPK